MEVRVFSTAPGRERPYRTVAAGLTSLCAGLAASVSLAQDAPPPPPGASATAVSGVVVTARRPTHLEGVTVTAVTCLEPNPARYPADRAPAVVDSYPHPGAVVAPGRLRVRVSFDASMSCYSEVTTEGGAADPCEPAGSWALPGRRSFTMQCRLEPDTAYKIHFRKAGGPGFIGLSGRSAEPFDLAFTTSHAPPILTPEAAERNDAGPPGSAPATAYLTCTDTKGAPTARDCKRRGVHRTPE